MVLSSPANANDCSAQSRLPPGPFSDEWPVSPFGPPEFEALLARAGVRLMPYPFDSAFAVASDVDGSTRETFNGYTRMLVHDLGLDFGDSVWLHWRYVFNAHGQAVTTNSAGFLSPSLTEQTGDRPQFFKSTRTLREVLADYHDGHIDHFHALLPHGPRVAVLKSTFREGQRLIADVPPPDATCRDFHVFAVCLVFTGRVEPGIRSVHVETVDGKTAAYTSAEHDHPDDGNSYFLFVRDVGPESPESVPHLLKASRIVAETSDAGGPVAARVILVSTYGRMLLDRLNFLREKYNVEMPLATEHAGLHFRNPTATERLENRNSQIYQADSNALTAFNGPLRDSGGKLVASVDSDQPHSFARVLPEAVDEGELRFIVPKPASKVSGLHATEVLAESPTRSGGGVYWAKRVQPNIVTPEGRQRFDGKTRHDTFVPRVQLAMQQATRKPGGFWPIYTHLGGLDGNQIPNPYFEPGPLLELQDRVFGISGNVPDQGRIWFARASTIYDYALVLQGIAERIDRPDPNSISLQSWTDFALGKTLPRVPSQLYGLTFYVEDVAEANVELDGDVIEHLIRNAPDASGRASVTIAECDISSTVFRGLDPLTATDARLDKGEWAWHDGERPHGRLCAKSEGAAARLRLPMYGTALPGAQLLSFLLRAEPGGASGVLLETGTGGRFWFGSGSLAAEFGELTATYEVDSLLRPDGWMRVVIPFHDLNWSHIARPGGPLPNHALEAVTLVSSGPAGTGAEFADMRLLRPRVSKAARRPERGHCIIGAIPGAGEGETVQLRNFRQPDSARTTRTDQLGWFSFTGVEPGLYEVVGSRGGATYRSARGKIVEVWSDIPRLELSERIVEDS